MRQTQQSKAKPARSSGRGALASTRIVRQGASVTCVLEPDPLGKWLKACVAPHRHVEAIECWPRGPKAQLAFILRQFGEVRSDGIGRVGARTGVQRKQDLFMLLGELRGQGYDIQNLLRLGDRHVGALILHWREKNLAESTMQTYLTSLRQLVRWLGKPDMIGSAKEVAQKYSLNPQTFAVKTYATKDKSWDANVGNVDELFASAAVLDIRFELTLRFMSAFGVRLREALCFQPHKRVMEVCADGVSTILIEVDEGTKGGRYRQVPVLTDEQRALLTRCKVIVSDPNDSLSGKNRTLEAAYNRFMYLAKKVGLTANGVQQSTAHGARHAYAHQRFEELSGVPPPIKDPDAIAPDKEKLRHAQQTVASELGHGRRAIHTAYSGSARRKNATTATSHEKGTKSLTIPSSVPFATSNSAATAPCDLKD